MGVSIKPLTFAQIKTQRGRGVTNVKVHPSGSPTESPSQLSTVTGRGRTDITYVGSGDRRPMRSVHISTDPNSKMYLTYSSAEFNGRVELAVKNVEIEHLAELDAEAAVLGKTEATVKHHEVRFFYLCFHLSHSNLIVDTLCWKCPRTRRAIRRQPGMGWCVPLDLVGAGFGT